MSSKSVIKKQLFFILGIFNFLIFRALETKKIKNAELVFFFPYYHPGGAERVHINILNALKSKKCVVIFTLGSATKSFYDDFNENAKVIELNAINNKKSLFLNQITKERIEKCINTSKTISCIFGANSDYYYQIIPNIKKQIKKIDLFHAFEENDIRIPKIIQSVSYINKRIVINQKAKSDIIQFYKENNCNEEFIKRIEIIPNGILLNKSKIKKSSNGNLKIGFIGRWSPEKRPDLFLKIAKNIKTKMPEVSFVMAGTGMRDKVNTITTAGIDFLGEITNKAEMNSIYESLDILICTSLYEGFPMVIMEAMTFGVIPITTNVGGIAEHIQNNFNGILINEKSESDIVNAISVQILNVINNELQRQTLSKNAKIYADSNFGIEKFNASYQNLFFNIS
jgi:glycosyltransferase involved in cell wall biosynthesis